MRIILFLIFLLFTFSTNLAHAETHVRNSDLWNIGATWTKEGSPYILDESIVEDLFM